MTNHGLLSLLLCASGARGFAPLSAQFASRAPPYSAPDGWTRFEDGDGEPYWLNAETLETTRDDPAAAAGACAFLGAAELEVALEDASSPLLVDGYAEWCGPCQLMAPVLDRVARALGARARVVKFDTEESGSTLAGRLAIEGLPTLLFFRPRADGGGLELAHRFEGAAPEEHVLKLVEHHFFGGPAPPAVNLR